MEENFSISVRSNWRANSSGLAACKGELSILSFRDRCASESAPGSGVRPIDLSSIPERSCPSGAELRRRRTVFQRALVPAVSKHFGKRVTRQTLHSDKRHGIRGGYPRLLVGSANAVIAVDPDESSSVVNGIMRAAIQWAPVVKRRIFRGGSCTPRSDDCDKASRESWTAAVLRLAGMGWRSLAPLARSRARWKRRSIPTSSRTSSQEVARIRALAPDLLQAVPQISGRAVSIRLRGLEVARVAEKETTYPLGEPLEPLDRETVAGAPSREPSSAGSCSRGGLAGVQPHRSDTGPAAGADRTISIRRFRVSRATSGRSSIS